jgi:hypothetical protein
MNGRKKWVLNTPRSSIDAPGVTTLRNITSASRLANYWKPIARSRQWLNLAPVTLDAHDAAATIICTQTSLDGTQRNHLHQDGGNRTYEPNPKEDLMTPTLTAPLPASPVLDCAILGDKLHISNLETNNLDVYRWDAPGKVPVFFVFAGYDVHIITLDDDEKPFDRVSSINQEVGVQIVTDEDIAMYSELAEIMLERGYS